MELTCSPLDFPQLIDVLSQGIVVLDRDLKVVLWNRWMETASQVDRSQVLGEVITEVFPDLVSKGFVWKVKNVFTLGNFAFFSQGIHRFLFPLTNARYLQSTYEEMQQNAVVAPLRGPDGRVEYACVSVMDCTDTVMYQDKLEATTRRLEEVSRTDHLTKLPNRRHLFERLVEELSRYERNSQLLVVALADIDHFKRVNDTHGHACGDRVLEKVASILTGCLRPYDTVGRYGGEEFCLLLPDTSLEDGYGILERLRRRVEETPIDCGDGLCLKITISLGLTSTESIDYPTPDALLRLADEAMYEAKEAGRNRTVAHGGPA